jgi:hypothetical protein
VSEDALIPFEADKPNVARGYDYVLGGKDNFAADRDLYAEVLRVFPLAGALVRENREFQARAVEYVATQGVSQFIKVGAGLPGTVNTHEAAARVSPAARVAYVDNDPVVISHLAALLACPGHIAAVPGDMRCPSAILASPALTDLIDTSQPFCLILDLVEPGLTEARRWRSSHPPKPDDDRPADVLAGVARKPSRG